MDIISAILDIDSKANEMLKEGEHRRDEIIDEAAKTEQSVAYDIEQAANEKINAFESEQKEKYLAEKSRISNKHNSDKQKLEAAYIENHEKWENDIFEFVIKGE